jgi:hypothetical protein
VFLEQKDFLIKFELFFFELFFPSSALSENKKKKIGILEKVEE